MRDISLGISPKHERNKMDEFYQSAIDILMGKDTDYRGICIALAKTNPKALCDAASITPWQLQARRIYYAEGKVAAIKAIRATTGMGLNEAKEAIEDIVGKDGKGGAYK